MIKYLQKTQYDKMILKINYIIMADWYANAAFWVHLDMKICTKGVSNMGKVEIPKNPMKQKISTKSSTEA